LFSKTSTISAADTIRVLEQSLSKYKFVVDYIERRMREGANMAQFATELAMAKQMVELLPQKIELVARNRQPSSK